MAHRRRIQRGGGSDRLAGRPTARSAALARRKQPSAPGCWRQQFQIVLMFRVGFDHYHARSPSAGQHQISLVSFGGLLFRRAADIATLEGEAASLFL